MGKMKELYQGKIEDDHSYYEEEIKRLREALKNAYSDAIDAVNKIKTDSLTHIGRYRKIEHSRFTAEDYMVAIAEDIEREIKSRAALREIEE